MKLKLDSVEMCMCTCMSHRLTAVEWSQHCLFSKHIICIIDLFCVSVCISIAFADDLNMLVLTAIIYVCRDVHRCVVVGDETVFKRRILSKFWSDPVFLPFGFVDFKLEGEINE